MWKIVRDNRLIFVWQSRRDLFIGEFSKWSQIKARVPQGSILRPLLFLVYINDLIVGLTSNAKLFAEDTLLFSMVCDLTSSSQSLNGDLSKILQRTYKWKILCNPDTSKLAQKIVFYSKKKFNHSDTYFNNMPLKRKNTQQHLGLYLDAKLNFSEYINKKKENSFQRY